MRSGYLARPKRPVNVNSASAATECVRDGVATCGTAERRRATKLSCWIMLMNARRSRCALMMRNRNVLTSGVHEYARFVVGLYIHKYKKKLRNEQRRRRIESGA